MQDNYTYSLDECDVHDKTSLAMFRKKRAEWVHLLEADKQHAIWTQISNLIWDDAVYRVLNEARGYSSRETPAAASNGLIGQFIDNGYVSSQVLGICRLTDPSDPKAPQKGVVSLRRLLDDIEAHQHLLTRESVVCYDGLPFDCDKAAEAYYSKHGFPEGEFRRLPSTGPEAFSSSKRAHKAFDKISGIEPSNRSRDDRIAAPVFQTIRNWLEHPVIHKFRTMRHKLIAHAADQVSRGAVPLDTFGITMNEVTQAQEVLVWIARAIGSDILYDTWHAGPLAIAQWNIFAHLDKPFVPGEKISTLRKWWDHHEKQWSERSRVPIDLITGQSTGEKPRNDS